MSFIHLFSYIAGTVDRQGNAVILWVEGQSEHSEKMSDVEAAELILYYASLRNRWISKKITYSTVLTVLGIDSSHTIKYIGTYTEVIIWVINIHNHLYYIINELLVAFLGS